MFWTSWSKAKEIRKLLRSSFANANSRVTVPKGESNTSTLYTPLPSVTRVPAMGSKFSRVIFFHFPFSLARDCCAFGYVCWRTDINSFKTYTQTP